MKVCFTQDGVVFMTAVGWRVQEHGALDVDVVSPHIQYSSETHPFLSDNSGFVCVILKEKHHVFNITE